MEKDDTLSFRVKNIKWVNETQYTFSGAIASNITVNSCNEVYAGRLSKSAILKVSIDKICVAITSIDVKGLY